MTIKQARALHIGDKLVVKDPLPSMHNGKTAMVVSVTRDFVKIAWTHNPTAQEDLALANPRVMETFTLKKKAIRDAHPYAPDPED